MDVNKINGKMVIFINHNQMIFYGSNIKNLVALPLKPEIIRDLEVVNKEALTKEITAFIQTNKILPAYTVIVLSSTLIFAKNFPPVSPQYPDEKLKTDIDLFLNYVPFQTPVNKTITTPKGTSVIVANGDLFLTLKQIFEANKFEVTAMIPLSLLDPQAGDNFSAHTGQTAQGKFDWIKQNSFLVAEPPKDEASTNEEEYIEGDDAKPKKTNRSFVLIGVVFMLIGVVAALLLMQRNKNLPAPKLTAVPTTAVSGAPSPSASVLPSPTGATGSAQIKDDTTTIQILNGSGIPGQAEILRRDLQAIGFSNIQTGNSIVTSAKTLIVFSQRVSPETKNRIIEAIKTQYPDLTTQDSNTVQSDVVITTARPVSPTPLP